MTALLLKRGWWLLAALCLFAGGEREDVFPYDIHKGNLDNGLQVLTIPFDSPGIVTFYMVVRVGSREEIEEGVTGFAHFFEHVMFRGTEKYPKEAYNKALQKMAADSNANTWYDRTVYYITGNADTLELMFEVESDRFQRLKYSVHGFKTEAGAVLGEYTKNFASPLRRILETTQDTAFDAHTYKHTTMGFEKDIKDMPNQYDYSLTFFDRFYRPEYCTLMVVGDTNHDQVMKLAKEYFGEWKRGEHKAEIPKEPEQTGERRAHVSYSGGMNTINMSYKTPAFSDTKKDKAAVDLFLEIAFSSRSEIYKKLVQREQKLNDLSFYAWDTRDPYLAHIIARPFEAEDVPYVKEEIEKTIEHFKTNKVDESTLADVKSRLYYSMAGALDTPFNIADNLATYIWLTGDPDSLNRTYKLYDSITAEDIQNAVKTYFTKDKRTIVTLGKEEVSL